MAALLVGLAVMAVVMSVAMPTWSHMIRREKEEELIFRGMQYARAINQYQRKFANASPASLDVLIEQRLLRKKFRDPLSPNKDGEFQLLYLQNEATTGGQGRGQGARGSIIGGGTTAAPTGSSPSGRGPVIGVVSKNTGQSIRVYKDKTRYNEWQFVGMELSAQPGPGAGATGRGGPQRGGRGGQQGSGGREGSRGGSPFMDRSGDPRTMPSRQGR
jgi:type II secretory pathway pseudopilin PulG